MKFPAKSCRPRAKLPMVRGSGADTSAVAGRAQAERRAAMRFCSLVHLVRIVPGGAMRLIARLVSAALLVAPDCAQTTLPQRPSH